MKNLIALAAILASTATFAASNKFTFQVNSSGANIYVCGFRMDSNTFNKDDISTYDKHEAYATWTEEVIDEWTGLPLPELTKKYSSLDFIFQAGMGTAESMEEEYDVGVDGKYKQIKDLEIFLGTENYGAEYYIDVCYNVPLYMDLEKVKFDITAKAAFTNMVSGRDYLDKAKVKSKVMTYTKYDDKVNPRNLIIANGNATTNYKYEIPSWALGGDSYVLKTTYGFKEMSSDRRPHVKHGGTFKLDTTVVPVSK